jgi:hypothetical protein
MREENVIHGFKELKSANLADEVSFVLLGVWKAESLRQGNSKFGV